MNNDLLNKIQERIDTDNIKPLPRWRFILLRASFWFLAILSVIIGSFVFVIILMFALYKSRRKIRAHYSSRSKETKDIIDVEESNSSENIIDS